MTDPESEALARKVSCKPSLRWPREVGVVAGRGLWEAMGVVYRCGPHKAAWLKGKWGPSPHCARGPISLSMPRFSRASDGRGLSQMCEMKQRPVLQGETSARPGFPTLDVGTITVLLSIP